MNSHCINDVTTRLSKILNAHLGVGLQSFAEVQGLDVDPELIVNLKTSRTGDMSVVCFSEKPDIDANKFEMTKDLIRSFLEGVLEGAHELDDLEQVSNHLESLSISDAIDQSDDVFRLSEYRKNPYPFVWNEKHDESDDELDQEEDHSEISATLILGSADAVYREAFDMHSRSGRFAFVKLSDLNPDVLNDAVAIRRLGNMTIFVPDITALTFAEQDKMLAIIATPSADEQQPHFIFAADTTLAELRRSHKVRASFLAILQPKKSGESSQTGLFLST